MKEAVKKKEIVTFSPHLRADDDWSNYWMRQVMVRLRREVCWLWHERGLMAPNDSSALPPFRDRASESLELSRFKEEKQKFFASNVTARYLTEQIETEKPKKKKGQARGSFGWVTSELDLDDAAAFTLATALTTAFDSSIGSVIACCLNDPAKSHPNLALIQRLWDRPEQVLSLADAAHPLFRYGLVKQIAPSERYFADTLWEQPLTVPSPVAHQLLFPQDVSPFLSAVKDEDGYTKDTRDAARFVAARLRTEKAERLRVVPLLGAKGCARRETCAAIARAANRKVVEVANDDSLLESESYLNSLATLCWLKDVDLFLAQEPFTSVEKHHNRNEGLPLSSIPATIFLAVGERKQLDHIAPSHLLPIVNIKPLSYTERVAHWKRQLGARAKGSEKSIAEISRRFRYEKETINNICQELKALQGKIEEEDLIAACRAELDMDIGELACLVTPRFEDEEVILPHKQFLQFEEQIKAMRSLTEVHYGWGTARAWNESGISVLFAGPPGTGKTMAAEKMAIKLNLPMYRIDLSQVVNKYIGETEKNLKRIFDAADVSDMILFFDEADSLFGRRTEVSDARDRYANLEISYLLERMERFKGLAILATNRKKDLDEAFLRRLRYIIDFPLPEEAQRKQIWRQVVPEGADSSEIDFDFLARQFPMAGGNIRSVIFNACLQCANGETFKNGQKGKLTMKDVLIAVKREYDKMNRTVSLEQFGHYASAIARLDRKQ
jgi:hypothetical protein